MGTKASRKNFYMEIRKSPGRFLSIFFIVALGVAFFFGDPVFGAIYADHGRCVFLTGQI